jgi:uncharacterized protein (TIGR01777 family)
MPTYRHQASWDRLLKHPLAAKRGSLRVAVTGSSGLVGSALSALLVSGGHQLWRLVRREATGEREILWDPAGGRIDAAALEGLDAVVHLAGENVAGGRWTPARKRAIRDSRVQGTRLLAETLAGLERPPATLVSASAIGYYGDRGSETLEETSPQGEGFLAGVAREWEEAAGAAARAGIRLVQTRIGVVLSTSGGALKRMLPPFRLGLGGPLGAGRQWMSWITLDDLLGVIHHALLDEGLSGPVNAVAPTPVTNATFTLELGRALRRPAFLPVPSFLIRLALGEMGEALLLSSTRVLPRRLQEADFSFLTPDLPSALRAVLGRERDGE